MSQSIEDQVSRLQAMCEPGQQTWDLSPKDVAAIALAVRVLSVIQSVNPILGISIYKTMIGAGMAIDDRHFQELSLLECFSEAGRELE